MRYLADIVSSVKSEGIYIDVRSPAHSYAWLSGRCNLDFPFFAKHVLGIKGLNDFHFEPVNYLYNSRFILVVWPRGHLKTTLLVEAYALWRLWREKNRKMGVVSSSLDQSEKTVMNIETIMENNEFLIKLIPEDRKTSWNKSQLNTVTKNELIQLPFNSSARGNHFDYLFVDDILREEKLSQEQIKDYFWSIFFPEIHTRKGQLLVVGTPMTTKDLFADLQNPPPEKQIILARAGLDCKTIKRAAVIVDDSGNWLKPIWDKRYTLEELRAIQISMSNLRFERELMCNPLGSGANIFRNIKLGSEESDKPFLDEDYYMGVDIAMQGGKKSDWFVISILGKNKKTNLVKQRKLERYQNYGPEQITKRIEELAEKFEAKKVILEKIGLGIGIIKELANKQKYPNTSRALEPFHTGKVGKEELVSSIMVGFDTNVLEILDNTIQYNELITFQAKEDTRSGKITYESVGEHDDCVCALGLAMNSILSEEKGGVSVDIVDFF